MPLIALIFAIKLFYKPASIVKPTTAIEENAVAESLAIDKDFEPVNSRPEA